MCGLTEEQCKDKSPGQTCELRVQSHSQFVLCFSLIFSQLNEGNPIRWQFMDLLLSLLALSSTPESLRFGADGYTSFTKEAKPLEWSVVPHREADSLLKQFHGP